MRMSFQLRMRDGRSVFSSRLDTLDSEAQDQARRRRRLEMAMPSGAQSVSRFAISKPKRRLRSLRSENLSNDNGERETTCGDALWMPILSARTFAGL